MRTGISLFLLLLWGVVLCLGVVWYGMGGGRAAREIGERLSSPENGVRVSVERAGLALLPVPGLRLSGIIVRLAPAQGRAGVSVYAETCVVRPAWKELFSGTLRLASIRLVRPTVLVTPASSTSSLPKENASPEAASSGGIPELFSGLRVEITDGRLETRGHDIVRLEGLNGEAVLPEFDGETFGGGRSGTRLSLGLKAVDWIRIAGEGTANVPDGAESARAARNENGQTRIALRDLHLDVDDVSFAAPSDDNSGVPPDSLSGVPGSIARARLRLSLDVASLLAPGGDDAPQTDPCRLLCAARLGLGAQGPTLVGEITLRGDLPLKGHPTPANLRIPFTLEPAVPDPTASLSGALTEALNDALPEAAGNATGPGNGGHEETDAQPVQPIVRIDAASLTLDGNAAVFTGRFLPGGIAAFLPAFRGATGSPRLEGEAEVRRFSLPRWFGFARVLPAGLQNALDEMQGELKFTLTPDALDITSLHASAAGMTFAGVAGVSDMAKPILTLNARAPEVDLEALFPELSGRAPQPRTYAMPPLVDTAPENDPEKGQKAAAARTDDPAGMGFDIRLAGDRVRWRRLSARGLNFRATPASVPEDSVKLAFGLESFYNGTVKAELLLGNEIRLSCSLHDVDSEKPVTLLAGTQRFGGVLSGSLDLRRNGEFGGSLADFIRNSRATFEIMAQNGFWTCLQGRTSEKAKGNARATSAGARQPFEKIVLAFEGQGTESTASGQQPDMATCSGNWRLEMNTADWQAALRLNGPVTLSTRTGLPLSVPAGRARLSAVLEACQVTASGNISFNTAKRTFTCTDMRGDLRPAGVPSAVPAALSGDLEMLPAKDAPGEVFSGRLSVSAPALRPLLWGKLPAETLARLPQEALRTLNASGSFSFSEKELRLENVRGRLDATTFSGTATRRAGAGRGELPRWTLDAQIGEIDLDRYMPAAPATRRRTGDIARATGFTRFLENLQTVEAGGRLSFDQCSLYKIRHDKLTLPFTLRQGVFTADPVRARVFGGQMGAGFRAEVLPRSAQGGTPGSAAGVRLRLRYTLADMDMIGLCRARKMDTSLSGIASFEGDFHGVARNPDDIPGAFSGTCAFRVRNGAIRSSADATSAPVTTFSSLSASGQLTNGVLSNNDLLLTGDTVSATGRGAMHLGKQTLDYRLNISLPGVPDIPVHYYGSLDKPERTVNAARAITGTLTNIGSGVLHLLEGAVSTPLRLMRP